MFQTSRKTEPHDAIGYSIRELVEALFDSGSAQYLPPWYDDNLDGFLSGGLSKTDMRIGLIKYGLWTTYARRAMQPDYRSQYVRASVDNAVLGVEQEDFSGGFFVMEARKVSDLPTSKYRAVADAETEVLAKHEHDYWAVQDAQDDKHSEEIYDFIDAMGSMQAQTYDDGLLGVVRDWISVPTSQQGCEWWHLVQPLENQWEGRFCYVTDETGKNTYYSNFWPEYFKRAYESKLSHDITALQRAFTVLKYITIKLALHDTVLSLAEKKSYNALNQTLVEKMFNEGRIVAVPYASVECTGSTGPYRSDEMKGKEVTLVRLCILDAELAEIYTKYVVAVSKQFGKQFQNSRGNTCATASWLAPLCHVEFFEDDAPAVVRGIPGPVGVAPAFLSPPARRDGYGCVALKKFLASELNIAADDSFISETFM